MFKRKIGILINKVLRVVGLRVVRYPELLNLGCYQKMYDQEVLSSKPFYNIGAGGFFTHIGQTLIFRLIVTKESKKILFVMT